MFKKSHRKFAETTPTNDFEGTIVVSLYNVEVELMGYSPVFHPCPIYPKCIYVYACLASSPIVRFNVFIPVRHELEEIKQENVMEALEKSSPYIEVLESVLQQ